MRNHHCDTRYVQTIRRRFAPVVFGAVLLLAVCLVCPSGQAQTGQQVEIIRLSSGQFAGLYSPEGKAKSTGLVFVHGTGGNFYNNAPPPILARAGYLTLAVNTRFHDNAQFIGDPPELEALDLAAGISYLKSRPGIERIILIGHSLGGPRVAFYQSQAQQSPGASGRMPELTQAQLTPAAAIIILAGLSHSPTALMMALNPCMAKFGRDCNELDLLKHGPPFNDHQYLEKLRSTQRKIYEDLVNYASKRLGELERAGDPLVQDEMFLVEDGALGSADPEFIDSQLSGCGENDNKNEEPVPVFFGMDAAGKPIVRQIKCKDLRAGRPPLYPSVEIYTRFLHSPRSTAVHTLRAFMKYRGPDSNYSIVRHIGGVTVPVLMVNGGGDALLQPWSWFDNMSAMRQASLKDVETYWIPNMSHGLTGPPSSFPEEQLANPPHQKAEEKLAAIITDWLRRKIF